MCRSGPSRNLYEHTGTQTPLVGDQIPASDAERPSSATCKMKPKRPIVHRKRAATRTAGSQQRVVRRHAALANVKRTLDGIDFDAMFRRIRDNLNAKAGWNAWT